IGAAPLFYQWFFEGTVISNATAETLALSNLQMPEAGRYSVIVSNSAGALTSSNASLTILIPPAIIMQPAPATANVGATAQFSVAAAGTQPLSYQWMFNSINISEATNSTLSVTNVQSNQAGSYSVVVTNSAGSTTSAIASLTVIAPPTITSQPTG